MIISQTPLRVSFFGGGTDLRAFYERHGGAVLSTAIDRSVYVVVKRRFDSQIRVSYTKTEVVRSVDEIQHDLVREAMRVAGIESGIEIVTLADVPSEGTGLGSSSSLTVGILNALYTYKGEHPSTEQLARLACQIEIETLSQPIGKQDQYIAAYGGLRHIKFHADGSTECLVPSSTVETKESLGARLLAFYTGNVRSSESILTRQSADTDVNVPILLQMREQVSRALDLLASGEADQFGRLLDVAWQFKKTLATGITNSGVDRMYERAMDAGALGGKLAGAGGGGFLILYVPLAAQQAVRRALSEYQELPLHMEARGTRIILDSGH